MKKNARYWRLAFLTAVGILRRYTRQSFNDCMNDVLAKLEAELEEDPE